MSHSEAPDPQSQFPAQPRRAFLQSGLMATVAGITASSSAPAHTMTSAHAGSLQDDAPGAVKAKAQPVIPRRVLGKTGASITMLNQGAVRGPAYDRILRLSFAEGIRTFDTARVYGTEGNLKKWFEQVPEVRKEIFLVTKDTPRTPPELIKMLDQRLEALGTDSIDLYFIHGLGDDHNLDAAINMVTSQEFQETAAKIKASGKAKFVGFSTHHKDRAQILTAAAKAGFVDAIMLQYSPWLDKDSPLNRALDACHKQGIGLISMKQIAGKIFGDAPKGNILEEVVKRTPTLKERNLTPFQGLLQAIWSDERICSICVSMRNTEQIRENVDAALRYAPWKGADISTLRDAVLAHGPTLCSDCDGRCAVAAGTNAALGDLTRLLTYYEHHGDRSIAREAYAALEDQAKDWSQADLDAAQAACPSRLAFAQLLPRARSLLS